MNWTDISLFAAVLVLVAAALAMLAPRSPRD